MFVRRNLGALRGTSSIGKGDLGDLEGEGDVEKEREREERERE